MGPIEKMVQDIIDKKLSEEYPQVQLPAIMKAQVTKATPLGDEYEYDELVVENKDSGSTFEAKITGKWFEYNLKILTKDGDPDSRYPEIPGVKSKIQIKAGGIAVVALLYGELAPFIIGEVG
jgi:hypothetical protein